MQFDWTTFVLEVINFLVLVWLLKHFFYKPVLNILDARQERVRTEVARAEQLQQEAETLKTQYEARLADWNRERDQARQQLEQELAQLKAVSTENIKKSLADEEAKSRVRGAAIIASREAELARQAAGEAYENASAMLRRLATPQLTASIVKMFQEDMKALPLPEQEALRKASQVIESGVKVEVASAHALNDKALSSISQSLSEVAGRQINAVFKLDPELIAGLRVTVGECLLHANLAEELQFFRRQSKYA